MSPRGSTRIGHPASLPPGEYAPPPAISSTGSGHTVRFRGEDGRSHRFEVSSLPLAEWHDTIASCWAARVGPAGGLRTKSSAIGAWGNLARFMRFISQLLQAPARPEDLTADHVDTFRRHREATVGSVIARRELRDLGRTLSTGPMRELITADAMNRFLERATGRLTPRSGYSDNEFGSLLSAARADVAVMRDRLDDTRRLLERVDRDPETLSEADVARAAALGPLARSGTADVPLQGAAQTLVARSRLAEQVFLTRSDLTPLLVLMVAVTGWNVETIKELPSTHRIIEGLAVELEVVKRRRGAQHWYQTVTWEIGPRGRELYTPGGLYLLLHRLMAPARTLAASSAFWMVWHNRSTPNALDQGVRDPFAGVLNVGISHSRWVAAHGLVADAPATRSVTTVDLSVSPEQDTNVQPLRLDFNRVKTSVDVRRTRQLGGHLPSAARSNTTEVLFANYLRGDQTTIDWAGEVMSETFSDVERSAWAAHTAALSQSGRTSLRIVPLSDVNAVEEALTAEGIDRAGAREAVAGRLDTAWTACVDHEHHPITGRRCGRSFLECFHCSNSLVIGDHLPGLLGLLDALEARRLQMTEEAWWQRYGPAWAAIRVEILPKFSEAELAEANNHKPVDALLDLVEPRWDQP